MKTEHKIHRLRPSGWTRDSFEVMEKLLKDGWLVKFITPIETDSSSRITHDYILERTINTPAKDGMKEGG